MKQLLILSGKGGTGKTTIAGAFIKLADAKAFADCDVDAPNLHLIMSQPGEGKHTDYYGMPKAVINSKLCVKCGKCIENCRFEAISADPFYTVNSFACEGCGVCEAVCASGAISLEPAATGALMLYANNDKVFSTARLNMGSGTSGKLVTEVKKQMISQSNAELAIIDGSPGIGCPVIASLSGVDLVLIVAEPSISGISDMERIIKTAAIFHTLTAVCVNKFNTSLENTEKIISYCKSDNIPFAGKIPFDTKAVKAINNNLSIADFDCISGNSVKEVYKNTLKLLYND